MSTRGRKPKPVELRRLEGNPGKRRIPRPPRYNRLTEHPPEELSPKAKALWRRLLRNLEGSGLVKATDREALIVMCDLWATYSEAMEKVREYGPLVKSKNNNSERAAAIVNPAWRVARDAIRELENMWARFGLTPSDRARFDLGDDDWDEDPSERDRRKEEEREFKSLLTGYSGGRDSEEWSEE